MTASHRIASSAFVLAGVFALVAVVWAVAVLLRGGSWWGPLHAFLAGTVLLAISGASQMFTITWAAAPAPRSALPAAQRRLIATGVAIVLYGVGTGTAWVAGIGAVIVIGGLALLGVSIVGAIRGSLLRRFDLASRFYLLAVASGVVGVALGGLIGAGLAGAGYGDLRLAHSRLNLVGLVGLTITGTLPTILPTFARHRAVSGRESRAAWWVAAAGVTAMVAGVAWGAVPVGVGVLLAGLALSMILFGVLVRLGFRGFRGRLSYLQVSVGCAWLVAWTVVDGFGLLAGQPDRPFAGWTAAAVVAGVGQVLFGSLAYLLAVLAGPPPRLGRNLERTHARPWLPLLAANVAGVALVAGWAEVAVAAASVWLLDFGARMLRIEWSEGASVGGSRPRAPSADS